MKLLRHLRVILSSLGLLGLLLGPVASTAMVIGAASDAALAAAMPEGCHEQMPATGCAKDCPLMAICVAHTLPPALGSHPASVRLADGVIQDDAAPPRLVQAPLPKPPRA